MFRNRPECYADQGRIRTYMLIPDQQFREGPEFDIRLMSFLHYSRQASHVKFVTTNRGYVGPYPLNQDRKQTGEHFGQLGICCS